MELQTKLKLFEILAGFFAFAWVVQAFYIHKLLNQIKVQSKVHSQLLVSAAEIQLAKSTIDFSKNAFDAVKLINDTVATVGDRLAAYNENLNHLTAAVRTKVERSERNTGH